MSPEAQRIAIAEACGWKNVRFERGEHVDIECREVCPWEGFTGEPPFKTWNYDRIMVPDYLSDLNAMHAAELALLGPDWDEVKWHGYKLRLYQATEPHRDIVNATAAQRAEALLRTIGKWEDGKKVEKT